MNSNLNTTILKKFPTAWNLNTFWLIILFLLMHLLYFFMGYIEASDPSIYENGCGLDKLGVIQVMFYILVGIMSLIFLSLKFFAYRPVRDLLPLGRFYFSKIFWQLVLIFSLYSFVLFSYEQGQRIRIRHNHSISESNAEFMTYMKAYAMLGIWRGNSSDFEFESRQYPRPFPFHSQNRGYYYDSYTEVPQDKEADSAGQEESIHSMISYNGTYLLNSQIDSNKPYLILGDTYYQMGELQSYKTIDGCDSMTKMTHIVDVSQIYGLKEQSRFNFQILPWFSLDRAGPIDQDQYDVFYQEIHQALLERDTSKIQKWVVEYYALVEKYRPSYSYDNFEDRIPANMIGGLVLKSELDTDRPDKFPSEDIYFRGLEEFAGEIPVGRIFYAIEAAYSDMGYAGLGNGKWLYYIMISMILALVMILAKTMPLRKYLISILVTGILSIMIGIFIAVFAFASDNMSGHAFMWIIFILCSVVLSIFINTLNQQSNQSVLDYGLISAISALAAVLVSGTFIVQQITARDVYDPCMGIHTSVNRFTPGTIYFFILLLVVVYFTFKILRRWRALPNKY